MSSSTTQTSPTKTSSPVKTATTINPSTTDPISTHSPQPSPIITDASPLTTILPSIDLKPNPTDSKPSASRKSKPKMRTKAVTTRKSQKPKTRYSSNFNMQELYLSNLGDKNPNADPDVATSNPGDSIEADKGEHAQTLDSTKGEATVVE
jgi:hypothetical protein